MRGGNLAIGNSLTQLCKTSECSGHTEYSRVCDNVNGHSSKSLLQNAQQKSTGLMEKPGSGQSIQRLRK